jgi:putative protease
MVNLGWELSSKDMQPLLSGAAGRQMLTVYGRIPMMITAGCVRKTAGACSHAEQDFYELEDRKGMRFPVRCFCAHCSNVIYNSLPLSLHTFVKKKDPAVMETGNWIVSFTTESGAETETILAWYRGADAANDPAQIFRDFTTGHFRKSAL